MLFWHGDRSLDAFNIAKILDKNQIIKPDLSYLIQWANANLQQFTDWANDTNEQNITADQDSRDTSTE